MILFLLTFAIYAGLLLCIKPSPRSLKATPVTFAQNFRSVRVSLFSGLLFLTVFFLTSNLTFIATDEELYNILALNNIWELARLWPLQAITHVFIHVNLVHVIVNVAGLGILSAYERRVGAKRFLSVFALANVSSIPSIAFYPVGTAVSGFSGGLFGVAAAYFTDHGELTKKEWIQAVIAFIFLVLVFSLSDQLRSDARGLTQLKVDHVGHAMGAMGAIIYCRLKPVGEKKVSKA